MYKALAVSALSLVSLFLVVAKPAQASVTCQPIYGGGQSCVSSPNILVNKTVRNPQTGQFVDNLGINDPKFGINQDVTFQITVSNTGNSTIDRTMVKDVFPSFVTFSSGAGNFDVSNRTLSFEVDNLSAGEQRTFTIVGKTQDSGTGVTCVVNQAIAQIMSTNETSQDNAQLCIEKGAVTTTVTTKGGIPVLQAPPMKTTPPTGPEMLPLVGLLPTGALGWLLRRKAK